MDKRLLEFDKIEWENGVFEGVRFKMFTQGEQNIRLVEFAPGFVEPDWCIKPHIGYVVQGSFELEFPDKTYEYKTGDGLFTNTSKNHKHIIKVSSNDNVILFLVD